MPAAVATLLIVLAAAAAFWSWGHAQAHVALNPDLDEAERQRWRVVLACVPGGLAAYWFLYVR